MILPSSFQPFAFEAMSEIVGGVMLVQSCMHFCFACLAKGKRAALFRCRAGRRGKASARTRARPALLLHSRCRLCLCGGWRLAAARVQGARAQRVPESGATACGGTATRDRAPARSPLRFSRVCPSCLASSCAGRGCSSSCRDRWLGPFRCEIFWFWLL